ncbi:MAG: hypothetical protein AAFO07_19335 [Bacteroidota bacterium]
MLFKQVIGQHDKKSALVEMVKHSRLPHSLLLLGPEGCGKLALAVALAQYLLCKNADQERCGKCTNCIKSSKLIHPDFHFAFPVVGTNATSDTYLNQWREALLDNPYMNINQWLQSIGAENKQGNINKEECVRIMRKLNLKTYEGARKIMLIWLPEYLGKEGNRLLKLIEEPPENTHFILVAERQELILNTILSRCQIVTLSPLQDQEIEAAIHKHFPDKGGQAATIARLANGNYNEALQLLQSRVNEHAKRFLEWMRKCYKGNSVELVNWSNAVAGLGRENQKHFLNYALHFFRSFLMLKMTNEVEYARLDDEELQTAERMLKVLEFDQVEAIAALIDDTIYAVERNANPKILFLNTSIKLNQIFKKKTAYKHAYLY